MHYLCIIYFYFFFYIYRALFQQIILMLLHKFPPRHVISPRSQNNFKTRRTCLDDRCLTFWNKRCNLSRFSPFKTPVKNGNTYAVRGGAVKKQVGRVVLQAIAVEPRGKMKSERGFLTKLDNRADDPAVAEREWRVDETGTEGNKTGTMLPGIIFCLLRQSNHPLGTTVFIHP